MTPTPAELAAMPGPKLDAVVAREVMGWTRRPSYSQDHDVLFWADNKGDSQQTLAWSPSSD